MMTRPRCVPLVLAAAAAALAATLGRPAPAAAELVAARQADRFVDSVGVAVHVRYTDTPYGRYDDLLKPALVDLGVRHIRDGGADPEFHRKLNDLAAAGIRTTLILSPIDGLTTIADVDARGLMPVIDAVEAIEGPNETDVPQWNPESQRFDKWFAHGGRTNGDAPDGKDLGALRLWSADLYNYVKGHADPRVRGLPVLMPSMAFPESTRHLGRVPCDRLNMHSYPGGALPDDQIESRWLANTRLTGPELPVVVTEVGYNYDVQNGAAGQPGVSDAAAAKYLTRLLLEYHARGFERTFLYELIGDEWGLIRNDGTRRPAFDAVDRLLAVLADPGPAFAPGLVDVAVVGSRAADVRRLVFQKRDGRAYVVLWRNERSFDTAAKRDLTVAPLRVEVRLAAPCERAAVHRPVDGGEPTAIAGPTDKVAVEVADAPVVVELFGPAVR